MAPVKVEDPSAVLLQKRRSLRPVSKGVRSRTDFTGLTPELRDKLGLSAAEKKDSDWVEPPPSGQPWNQASVRDRARAVSASIKKMSSQSDLRAPPPPPLPPLPSS